MKKYLGAALFLINLMPIANAIDMGSVQTTASSQSKIQLENTTKKQWGIDQVELDRYNHLMRGIRGSISVKNISPLEVLGIHARDDAEREKYALAWAKAMREDTEKVLKFQRAYDNAAKVLSSNQQMINMAEVNRARNQNKSQSDNSIKENERVLLFVRYNDCSRCERTFSYIKSQMASLKRSQLDIYFIDTKKGKDDKKLREWAKRNGLDRTKLIKGKITLNHNRTLINKHFGMTAEIPIAAVLRAGQIERII